MKLVPGEGDARTPYAESFYRRHQDGSANSAQVVVPIILSLFPCHSVVDVGCGVGGWLKEFERQGVSDYLGVDGDYVSRDMLKIPGEHFRPVDLRSLSDLGRGFDLACSLEVAEHLPEDRAKSFVALLVKAAPVVLFSAAIPFQGGMNHLNEQPQSYWARLFAVHGYIALDCIRPVVYGNRRVEWWYRQNILIFCEPDKCPPAYMPVSSSFELDRVDPGMVEHMAKGPHSGRAAAQSLLRSSSVLTRAIMRKIGARR
jgi:SAM-dependent methyltransferase